MDADTGWAVGTKGTVLKTTDGGATWISQIGGMETDLNGVYFTDANTGWVVGNDGFIFHTVTGGETWVDEVSQLDFIPTQFALLQNYPNPFNPTTTICFRLPKASAVSLKVYNLLGQEVETLVAGHRAAGEYRIEWNAENLPGGIYLYRLVADDFVETRKMTLLK